MMAMIKRELRSYLFSARGIVFLSLFLLAIGGYTVYYNLLLDAANTAYTLIELYIPVTLILPILTYGLLFEERGAGRYKLLRSLGLGGGGVVGAKLISLICFAALPFALLAILPIALGAFGEMTLSISYFGLIYLLGYFAAYASLATLMSAIFRSKVLATVLTYFAGALMFFLESFVFDHLYYLLVGIFDYRILIYHLSIVAVSLVIAIFLYSREGFARRSENEN